MSKKDDKMIDELVRHNVPFVLFREPGSETRVVIQNSPISRNERTKMDQKGFYAFPFSKREKSQAIFIKPDYDLPLASLSELDIELKELELVSVDRLGLYEVGRDEYIKDLNRFLEEFDSQGIRKAIYSRVEALGSAESLDLRTFFLDLCETYPKAFTYLLNIPGDGIWAGASPELLLSFSEGRAKTVALAGTLKIDNKRSAPDWTRKEIDEHRLVEKYIMALCERQEIKYEKSAVRTSNTGKVYHLKSDFEMEIDSSKIQDFLQELHPTPAISGLPQDKSLNLIYEVEKYDRSYYCGFLGYVQNTERFNLFINLRCMKIVDNQIYLFAGGGITPDSDIEKEWEETKIKMSTLTDLLQKDVDHEEISSVTC